MLLSRRRMDRHSPFCLQADGIVLLKYKPMIEGFKNAIAEERKKGASEARIAAMLHYIETTSSDIDPDAMEWMRIELAEAAKATNRGPGTVQ
jgi:hypothetical protein